jgi:uncharacterized protein (TIGR02391 family)
MARRWDDLDLLRTIDRIESESPAEMRDGRTLMEAVAGGPVTDERDYRAFIHELHLARDGGCLTFRIIQTVGVAPPDPDGEPNLYLQQIDRFALTLAGRDRAQGRVIAVPLPEPDEDDGRPIALMTIEEIARAVGNAYSGEQLPRFLEDSGVPAKFIPPFEGTKWRYVADVLGALLNGGSESRRRLRELIGAWLDNRLHSGATPDQQARLVRDLARQGWHLQRGRLVVGEQVVASPIAATLASEANLARLHPGVLEAAEPLYRDGHRAAAVFEAYKAVESRVRALSGRTEIGKDLMAKAFNENAPLLPLNDGITVSEKNEREGFKYLFMGAMQGVRNPKAHDRFSELADDRALDYLAFASLLMRRLDDAEEGLGRAPHVATSVGQQPASSE